MGKKGAVIIPLAVCLLFTISCSVFAQDEIFTASDLTASLAISSNMDIVPLGNNWRIDKLRVEQTFFPKDAWNQDVLELDNNPEASINDSAINYVWEPPGTDSVGFAMDSMVKVTYGFMPVDRKISFPLLELPEDLQKYVIPQKNIDSEKREIIEKASELAKGESDLYVVVFNVAEWIQNNIEYSLDSLTAEASQKASWVLENKEGVCDELTSLFVAMLRSLGIPARYISGVAYTNWNSLNDFGPHAWAEVYFPGYGWIPFDITYGEFGFVDAGHIRLKESLDSNEPTVNYRWDGWLVDIQTHRLKIETEVASLGSRLNPDLILDVAPLKDRVKFGSYNLIEAEIYNPNSYYYPTEVIISRSSGLELVGDSKKQVLLLPGERKKVYWVMRVDSNLDKSFIYTFRIIVQGARNATGTATFVSSDRDQSFDLEYINGILAQKIEERQKTYSRSVGLECKTDKSEYYLDEIIKMDCDIRNEGNAYLKDVSMCYENDCKMLDLGIAEKGSVSYAIKFESEGAKNLDIVAKNEFITKTVGLSLTMLDPPMVSAEGIITPESLEFGKSYTMEFTLLKDSFSEPVNLNVRMAGPMGERTWQVPNMSQDRKFYVSFESSMLNPGQNDFEIVLDYEDKLGRKFTGSKTFAMQFDNLNFLQRLQLKMNSFARNFSSLDIKLVVMIAFAFGIALGFIFRPKKHKAGVPEDYLEKVEGKGLDAMEPAHEIEPGEIKGDSLIKPFQRTIEKVVVPESKNEEKSPELRDRRKDDQGKKPKQPKKA
ncbi:MAG: transglutaminase protein [archaeon GW2011_AR3]|nr:MAG: transglutaminase protein [archaeon GW2011_AR3]MBS3108986.1 transglutaminase domain-containing protein [Candidatus Woesearchaeota archaeon]